MSDGNREGNQKEVLGGDIMEVNDKNFQKEVIESKGPVLVDFWAQWCPPCKMLAPLIEKLTKEYADKMKICKLDVDESSETASKYNIRAVPTLVIFKDGKEVERQIGALPENKLREWLNSHLGS